MSRFLTRASLLSRRKKVALQLVFDAILMIICFLAAMALRYDHIQFLEWPRIWLPVMVSLPLALITFSFFGLYRTMMRFVTSKVLTIIGKGVLISAIAMYVSNTVLVAQVPRSVPFIYAVFVFMSIGGIRFAVRHYFRLPDQIPKSRVAIYGAGAAGRELLYSVFHGRDYTPVAFIDADPDLQRLNIGGFPVFAPSALETLTQDMDVDVVLLAIPSLDRAQRRQIIEHCQELNLEIKTIPTISDIIDGTAKISDLRRVTPDELLGRDPVAPIDDLLRKNIAGKAVLVTGAGGSIGSEICRQVLSQAPEQLLLFEFSEFALYTIEAELSKIVHRNNLATKIVPILGSTQHMKHVEDAIKAFNVKTLFHTAAYKHVPLVEENIVEGMRNNVFGTLAVARMAHDLQVENFILISTDKAVRPTNIMGATKRIAELICASLSERGSDTVFSMVRFGNVLGSSGSVIPRFQEQIEAGGPITVTHRDINRYFMTIPEASQLVIQAGAMATGGDVFVLDMGEPVKISILAETMVRLHGLTPYFVDHPDQVLPDKGDIPICFTGLRKGEKLYEELLIGNNAEPTQHPRIMKASEISLPYAQLMPILDRLFDACEDHNLPVIQEILKELPLAYTPSNENTVGLG